MSGLFAAGLIGPYPFSVTQFSPGKQLMRTYSPKASEITRAWHVIDADGLVLGRLCTEVARLLRGKHKPIFAPHLDTGDHVIVINARKVVLTSGKAEHKAVYRFSGYPGGLKQESYAELLARKPAGGRSAFRARDAAQGPARSSDAQEAQGLRRPGAPAQRARACCAGPAPGQGSLSARKDRIVTKPLTQTTGRRKEAVARVRLRPGTGTIIVNRRPFEDYFPVATHRMLSSEALRVTSTEEVYDIDATLDGGGISGQAGALRLGIARALCELDPEMRAQLKRAGLLTRDAREKESKKAGLKKARKAPQYSKR